MEFAESTQVLAVDEKSFSSSRDKVAAFLTIRGENHSIYYRENVIGRDPNCQIFISDKPVSIKHAIIDVENQESHFIHDLGSTNKTKLGKAQLKPNVRYLIRDGDELVFANVRATYNYVKDYPEPDVTEILEIPETPEKGEGIVAETPFKKPILYDSEESQVDLFEESSLKNKTQISFQIPSPSKEEIYNISTQMSQPKNVPEIDEKHELSIYEIATQSFVESQSQNQVNPQINETSIYDEDTEQFMNNKSEKFKALKVPQVCENSLKRNVYMADTEVPNLLDRSKNDNSIYGLETEQFIASDLNSGKSSMDSRLDSSQNVYESILEVEKTLESISKDVGQSLEDLFVDSQELPGKNHENSMKEQDIFQGSQDVPTRENLPAEEDEDLIQGSQDLLPNSLNFKAYSQTLESEKLLVFGNFKKAYLDSCGALETNEEANRTVISDSSISEKDSSKDNEFEKSRNSSTSLNATKPFEMSDKDDTLKEAESIERNMEEAESKEHSKEETLKEAESKEYNKEAESKGHNQEETLKKAEIEEHPKEAKGKEYNKEEILNEIESKECYEEETINEIESKGHNKEETLKEAESKEHNKEETLKEAESEEHLKEAKGEEYNKEETLNEIESNEEETFKEAESKKHNKEETLKEAESEEHLKEETFKEAESKDHKKEETFNEAESKEHNEETLKEAGSEEHNNEETLKEAGSDEHNKETENKEHNKKDTLKEVESVEHNNEETLKKAGSKEHSKEPQSKEYNKEETLKEAESKEHNKEETLKEAESKEESKEDALGRYIQGEPLGMSNDGCQGDQQTFGVNCQENMPLQEESLNLSKERDVEEEVVIYPESYCGTDTPSLDVRFGDEMNRGEINAPEEGLDLSKEAVEEIQDCARLDVEDNGLYRDGKEIINEDISGQEKSLDLSREHSMEEKSFEVIAKYKIPGRPEDDLARRLDPRKCDDFETQSIEKIVCHYKMPTQDESLDLSKENGDNSGSEVEKMQSSLDGEPFEGFNDSACERSQKLIQDQTPFLAKLKSPPPGNESLEGESFEGFNSAEKPLFLSPRLPYRHKSVAKRSILEISTQELMCKSRDSDEDIDSQSEPLPPESFTVEENMAELFGLDAESTQKVEAGVANQENDTNILLKQLQGSQVWELSKIDSKCLDTKDKSIFEMDTQPVVSPVGGKLDKVKRSGILDAKDTSLSAKDQCLEAKDISLDAKDKSLDAKDISLDAKDKSLGAKDISLDAKDKSLGAKDISLDAKDKSLGAKDISLDAQSISEMDTQPVVSPVGGKLDKVKRIAKKRSRILDTKDKSLDAKDTSLSAKDQCLEANTSLDTKHKSLDAEHKSISEMDTQPVASPVGGKFGKVKRIAKKRSGILDTKDKSLEAKDTSLSAEDQLISEMCTQAVKPACHAPEAVDISLSEICTQAVNVDPISPKVTRRSRESRVLDAQNLSISEMDTQPVRSSPSASLDVSLSEMCTQPVQIQTSPSFKKFTKSKRLKVLEVSAMDTPKLDLSLSEICTQPVKLDDISEMDTQPVNVGQSSDKGTRRRTRQSKVLDIKLDLSEMSTQPVNQAMPSFQLDISEMSTQPVVPKSSETSHSSTVTRSKRKVLDIKIEPSVESKVTRSRTRQSRLQDVNEICALKTQDLKPKNIKRSEKNLKSKVIKQEPMSQTQGFKKESQKLVFKVERQKSPKKRSQFVASDDEDFCSKRPRLFVISDDEDSQCIDVQLPGSSESLFSDLSTSTPLMTSKPSIFSRKCFAELKTQPLKSNVSSHSIVSMEETKLGQDNLSTCDMEETLGRGEMPQNPKCFKKFVKISPRLSKISEDSLEDSKSRGDSQELGRGKRTRVVKQFVDFEVEEPVEKNKRINKVESRQVEVNSNKTDFDTSSIGLPPKGKVFQKKAPQSKAELSAESDNLEVRRKRRNQDEAPPNKGIKNARNAKNKTKKVEESVKEIAQESTEADKPKKVRNARSKKGENEDNFTLKKPPEVRTTRSRKKLEDKADSGTIQASKEDNSDSTSTRSSPRRRHQIPAKIDDGKFRVLFTGYSDPTMLPLIERLNGEVVDNPLTCTVVVTNKVKRTVKLLCGVAQGRPIVSPNWLRRCRDSGYFLDPFKFLLVDKEAEARFSFCLRDSIHKAMANRLLQGWTVFATPSTEPPPGELQSIVECSGGVFLQKEPASWSKESFVISCPEDKIRWAKLKKRGISPLIVSSEILLTGVLRQVLDLKAHTLK